MNAAATVSTDSAVPASALRTGTAVRPRPGSRANRAPVAAVTGTPAPASHATTPDGRPAVLARAAAAALPADPACHAAHAARATSSAAIAAAPRPSTATSALTPGPGSARRAGPIGVSGDAATATATAMTAAAAAAAPTSTSPAAVSWARVMPSAASVALSDEAASSRRVATCPTTNTAVTASTSANSARATAWGRMDRSMTAACVPSSATNTWPFVSGNWRASACAWRLKAATVVPGRSRTYAPSKAA